MPMGLDPTNRGIQIVVEEPQDALPLLGDTDPQQRWWNFSKIQSARLNEQSRRNTYIDYAKFAVITNVALSLITGLSVGMVYEPLKGLVLAGGGMAISAVGMGILSQWKKTDVREEDLDLGIHDSVKQKELQILAMTFPLTGISHRLVDWGIISQHTYDHLMGMNQLYLATYSLPEPDATLSRAAINTQLEQYKKDVLLHDFPVDPDLPIMLSVDA